jgi:hypothetical protein
MEALRYTRQLSIISMSSALPLVTPIPSWPKDTKAILLLTIMKSLPCDIFYFTVNTCCGGFEILTEVFVKGKIHPCTGTAYGP